MKLPANVEITLALADRPVNGMFAKLKFNTLHKSSFALVFGPSDRDGVIKIDYDEIATEAKKTIDLFPMDYHNLESVWTGELTVIPLNLHALEAALSASRFYRLYNYPARYQEGLETAIAALVALDDAELTASVRLQTDESIPIRIESVTVRTKS